MSVQLAVQTTTFVCLSLGSLDQLPSIFPGDSIFMMQASSVVSETVLARSH